MDEVTPPEADGMSQLMVLKGLTKTTGGLHEAQVLQLKYMPLIATHATKSEFTYNYDNKEIIFNLTEVKGPKPRDFKKRLQILSNNVKFLIGEEYRVVIKLKGKIVHSKKGKTKNDAPKSTRSNRANRRRKRRV